MQIKKGEKIMENNNFEQQTNQAPVNNQQPQPPYPYPPQVNDKKSTGLNTSFRW